MNKYDKWIFLLIFSLITGNIGGALQSTRILSLLFVLAVPGALNKAKENGGITYIKPIILFFSICLIWGMASLLWTPAMLNGVVELVYYIVHIALFIEILLFSKLANNPLRSISLAWMLGFLATSVIGIWEIVTDQHLSFAFIQEDFLRDNGMFVERHNASVTFGNYNTYVTYIGFVLPFILYMILQNNNKIHRFLGFISLFLSTYILFNNASRGGIFCLIIAFFILFIGMIKNKKNLIGGLFISACVILILGIMIYRENLLQSILLRSQEGLTSDNGRPDIWLAALQIIFHDYVGLGSGLGSMQEVLTSKNVIGAAHNLVVEVALSFGVFITVLFLYNIIKLLFRSFKIKELERRLPMIYTVLVFIPIFVINSTYLLLPPTWCFFASVYVFINYDKIKGVCSSRSNINPIIIK